MPPPSSATLANAIRFLAIDAIVRAGEGHQGVPLGMAYALLHLTGYERMGIEQVSTFRDFGSRCEGHPEIDPASGIEVTTGPLGQGIANASTRSTKGRISW